MTVGLYSPQDYTYNRCENITGPPANWQRGMPDDAMTPSFAQPYSPAHQHHAPSA
jgi:hypothetical protein